MVEGAGKSLVVANVVDDDAILGELRNVGDLDEKVCERIDANVGFSADRAT